MPKEAAVSIETLTRRIHLIRGQKVMLDSDLAELYGVATRTLNQAVKRNHKRFPEDFLFQLTALEVANLRSQIVISRRGHGGSRYAPFAFTEHGAVMAATVLNSSRAVQMSIFVVRAFVQLREFVSTQRLLATKLRELERKVSGQGADIAQIFQVLRQLMAEPSPNSRGIGFTADLG